LALRFFLIPVRDSHASEQELNGFLTSHKILSMERHLIDQGSNSFWAICIDYLTGTLSESSRPQNLSRNRIDYKTILSPDEPQRTSSGVPFLGCRIYPTHVELNRRNKHRWRCRVRVLERAERLNMISEQELQNRLVSLSAFARSAGTRSWRFRQAVLQRIVVNDP
jgi:hypothetical protein